MTDTLHPQSTEPGLQTCYFFLFLQTFHIGLMRDIRFKAERLGGLLKFEEHILLMNWAIQCVEHICPLLQIEISNQINHSLAVAKRWTLGNASVKDARNVAIAMNELAKITTNLAEKYAIKAAGHAVATAHMADHAVVASKYTLKSFYVIHQSTKAEIDWQVEHLPKEMKEFIVNILLNNKKGSIL